MMTGWQADEEVEPSAIDVGRNDGAVVDGEGLVAQRENEIRLLGAHVLEPAEHGDAVEQMTGTEHDGQHERDERVERGHQQIHGDEFHGTGEDERAHAHGPQEGETTRAHQHAI